MDILGTALDTGNIKVKRLKTCFYVVIIIFATWDQYNLFSIKLCVPSINAFLPHRNKFDHDASIWKSNNVTICKYLLQLNLAVNLQVYIFHFIKKNSEIQSRIFRE